jgi:hypothetical protein
MSTNEGRSEVALTPVKVAWPPEPAHMISNFAGTGKKNSKSFTGPYRKILIIPSTTYPQVLPTTLGIEGAGTIEGKGVHTKGLHIGDRVAFCLSWGSYAEYAVVPAWRVVALPAELPLEAGATNDGRKAHHYI